MFHKSILVTALLALAIVQTLVANCDLNCALTHVPGANSACIAHARIAANQKSSTHCDHDSAQLGDHSSFMLCGHMCGVSFCGSQVIASNRVSANESSLGAFQRAASFTRPSGSRAAGNEGHSSAFGTVRLQTASAPLELRPGSSLRI
jgi:hypothetical protein